MSSEKHTNAVKSKNHVNETIVGWDEFRKLVHVGDTYKAYGVTKTVTRKTFELNPSDADFTIHIGVA